MVAWEGTKRAPYPVLSTCLPGDARRSWLPQEESDMKVLLAIDSSEHSEPVIMEVATRPWPPGTVVHVLTVVDLFALTYAVGTLKPFIKNE